MARKRTVETNEGIRGELSVKIFDSFARNMHDKGGNSVDSIIKVGITKGNVLEIITAIPLIKVESSILFVSTKKQPKTCVLGCFSSI